eukprot:UN24319
MTRQSVLKWTSNGGAQTRNITVLIPGHDFVNSQQQGTILSGYEGNYLTLKASVDVEKGEEIFMDYGARTSEDMLNSNGFVVKITFMTNILYTDTR